MSRERRFVVETVDEVIAALAAERAVTAIVDVEPMVAPWGCTDEAYFVGVAALIGRIRAGAPTVARVFLASNAPTARPEISNVDPMVTITFRAGKPWHLQRYAGARRPIVVVGDQPLTDGLLAWRLGGTYLLWRHRGQAPWWPRWQLALGRVVTAPLFVTGTPRTEQGHERGTPDTRGT